MPYFIRRSYDETIAATSPVAPETDVVALAEHVLAEAPAGTAVLGPFRIRRAVAAGSKGETVLEFAPEERDAPMRLRLTPGALRSGDDLLGASYVEVDPDALDLGSGSPGRVRVRVSPPDGTPPGTYRGVIAAEGDARFAVAIEVEVGPSSGSGTTR